MRNYKAVQNVNLAIEYLSESECTSSHYFSYYIITQTSWKYGWPTDDEKIH
jgi:hypothetical protein